MLRHLSLILVLMNISNFGTVFAVGENATLFQNRPDINVDYFRLFSLRVDDIKSVEVYWGTTYGHKTLTTNEIHSLIRILNKVRKQDIEPFRGPSPKGGPRRMTLLLKSDENLSLTLNGDYIIYEGHQANQPEIREFMNQVMKSD